LARCVPPSTAPMSGSAIFRASRTTCSTLSGASIARVRLGGDAAPAAVAHQEAHVDGLAQALLAVPLEELLARGAARELARGSARQRVWRHQLDQAADAELGRNGLVQPVGHLGLLLRVGLAALHD